jgi:hypothetical protein
MNSELKQKVENYVRNKYTVEQQKIRREFEDKMAALPTRGRGNGAYSVYADERHIRLYIEMVNSWARAMGNIQIAAYEIYRVPLDDDIITEVKKIRDGAMGAVSGSVSFQMELEGRRGVRDSGHGKAIAQSFRRQLTVGTHYIEREISCLIEERKAAMSNQKNTSVGAINMNAPGQRVVFGDDHSYNSLTITEQSFFAEVGRIVKTELPPEKRIDVLTRLSALENSLHKPDFNTNWQEFRAAAADYWGFIVPALPLIQDFLQRHGISLT